MKRFTVLLLILLMLSGCQQEQQVEQTPPDVSVPQINYMEMEHSYITEFTLPFSEWYQHVERVGNFTFYSAAGNSDIVYTHCPLAQSEVNIPAFSTDWVSNAYIASSLVTGYKEDMFFEDFNTLEDVIDLQEWVHEDQVHGLYLEYSRALCRFTYLVYAYDTTVDEAIEFIEYVTGLDLDTDVMNSIVEAAGGAEVYCYLSDSIIVTLTEDSASLTWYVVDYNSMQMELVDTTEYDRVVLPASEENAVLVPDVCVGPEGYTYEVNDITEETAAMLVNTISGASGYKVSSEVYSGYIQLFASTERAHFTMAFDVSGSQLSYYTANVDYNEIVRMLRYIYGFDVDESIIAKAASYSYNNGVQVTLLDSDWILAVMVEYLYDYPILNIYAAYG